MRKDEHNGGIYLERKVYLSKAYKALTKNARMVLLAMLDARQTNPAFKPRAKKGHRSQRFIDLDKITMPYAKLKEKFGVPAQSVPRAIDDLLAKGFIEIKHVGGAGEHDMSVYALVEDYLTWQVSTVFRRRKKDVNRGYQGKGLGVAAKQKNKTRTQNVSLKRTQNVSLLSLKT